MKLLLFVQGEGRGHMSQALTLQEKLKNSGHEVAAVFIGASNLKDVPDFFKKQFSCSIYPITSPKFKTDKNNKGVNIFKSIFFSILETPKYIKSVKKINSITKQTKPDALISFYEPLLGNYLRLYKNNTPSFFIGHQYFLNHDDFQKYITFKDRCFFNLYNRFTAPKKSIKIALSFTKEKDIKRKNLYVCPPLIKSPIKNSNPRNKPYVLSYILNPGYLKDLKREAITHKNLKIETFTKEKLNNFEIPKNLNINLLSNELFIKKLSECSYYISTAGFDSISEAAYLQKQIQLIPTKGHIEQKYNGIDAERSGIGINSNKFDLSLFFKEKTNKESLLAFKEWVDKFDNKIIQIIENLIKD